MFTSRILYRALVPAAAWLVTQTAVPARAVAQDQGSSGVLEASVDPVVVTARRRDEQLQNVPLSVTLITGGQLEAERITSKQDLLGRIPSLVVGTNNQNRSSETFSLRGQGATILSSQGAPIYLAEAPVISGNYFSTQGAPGLFLDLQSIQVVKGPQGTLFGRNTTGGAVLVEPVRPRPAFEATALAGVGSYNRREAEGVLNAPIVEGLAAARLSIGLVDQDGFTRNLIGRSNDEEKYVSARLGLSLRA